MRNSRNKQETFTSQLCELWKSCSKLWLSIVFILAILTALLIYFLKLYYEYGRDVDQIWYLLEWDASIIQFFLLSFFIWLLLFNKKVFSTKNIKNRTSRFKMTFDRIISQGHSIQFYWLVGCFFILFLFLSALMGTFDAFGVFPNDKNLNWNPLSLTYLLLTDSSTIGSILKSNTHVINIIAIICIIVSVLGTLLFTGLLVSVFSNFLQRRVDDYKQGMLRYNLSGHIVFVGYDEILPPLVQQCVEYETNKDRKIIIQTKLASEQVREDIKTLIPDESLFRNIIFYNGRRDSIKDLRSLGLDKASEIFVIGNRQNDNHDELNLQCLRYIRDIIENSDFKNDSEQKTLLHILIEDHTEYSKMKFLWENETMMDVDIFNIYAIWAKALIHAKFDYPKIEISDKEFAEGINIIIFGMSKYGSSIGIETINCFKQKKKKTILTFVCDNATYEMDMFRARFSELFNYLKCTYTNLTDSPIIFDYKEKSFSEPFLLEIEFIESNPFNKNLYHYFEGRKMKKYMFFCSEKNTKDLNGALFVPAQIKKDTHIYILQKHGVTFIEELHYYTNIHPFGVLNPTFDIYKYLSENPFELIDKYESYIDTANIYESQGNYKLKYYYRKQAYAIGVKLFGRDELKEAETEMEKGDNNSAYKLICSSVIGYDSLECARCLCAMGWDNYYSYDNQDISDWSMIEAAEFFGRAIGIQEMILGKYPENLEDLINLSDSYLGSYQSIRESRVTDWHNDFERYQELSKLIAEKTNQK